VVGKEEGHGRTKPQGLVSNFVGIEAEDGPPPWGHAEGPEDGADEGVRDVKNL
jgi:hypothetical protein